MSASLFAAAPAQEQSQAINDYVSQVMAGDWTDQQKAQMIQNQAAAVGVTPDQIAAATGYSPQNVNAYLGLAATPVSLPKATLNAGGSSAPTADQIAQAEQAARQVHMDMGMAGRNQTVDPSVYQTLFGLNNQGQVVRRSDNFVAPFSMGSVQNPNAKEYYQQNPQELFALGALGGAGGQGYFKEAGVRGTNLKYGQLTPDQWYQGYTSNFPTGWSDNPDLNYRWAGQKAPQVSSVTQVAPIGGSGSPVGGSTAGSGGIVEGMFTDYAKRPSNAGIPSDYNPNQASAGGASDDYNQQMQAYYKAYFGDSSSPNMNMLNSWYGGQYSPTPTGFSSANKGASSAKTLVQSLKWDPANFDSSLKKLNEYRQLYGLSTKDIADAVGTDEGTVIAEFSKRGITIPVTSASNTSTVTEFER